MQSRSIIIRITMRNIQGITLNTKLTIEEIVDKSKKNQIGVDVITPDNKTGYIKVRIEKHQTCSVIDIDFHTDAFNHDLSETGSLTLNKLIYNQIKSSLTPKIINKYFHVGKEFLTFPTLKNKEIELLKIVFEEFKNPEYFEIFDTRASEFFKEK